MDDESPLAGFFPDYRERGDATRTTIASLGLRVRRRFFYWFDFGDDWWHDIRVAAIRDEVPPGKYPRVVERVGESPPQYPDWDEEEGMDD